MDYDTGLISEFETALQEFEPELQVDKLRLDSHIEQQADLYYRVAKRAAEAISLRDRAKHEAQLIEAVVASRIRDGEYPEHRGKITEGSVKEAVTLDKECKAAQRLITAWDRVAKTWIALEKAFGERGDMLRYAAQLYTSGYFTISSAGRARDDVKDERAKYGRQLMNEDRQNRRKL